MISQDSHNLNDVQEEDKDCVSNEHIWYDIDSQDAEHEHEE